MTRQEHFEQWMRHQYPNIPLEYRSSHDYYVDDRAFYAYQAWKEAPLRRPCEKGQITKEQLKAMKENDDPKTIVDRLNGWYGQTTEPYKVPEIQQEAAREIVKLREEIERLKA
jgi:hypothetical protein